MLILFMGLYYNLFKNNVSSGPETDEISPKAAVNPNEFILNNISLYLLLEVMLEKRYNERKDLLKMEGIGMSLEGLIKLYKNDKC